MPLELNKQDFVKKPKKNKTSRSWIFTLNNYTDKELKAIMGFECTKRAVGKEVGDSGTPHLQGFICFKRAYRLSGMKKIMPRAHLEIPDSAQHAWNYCLKEGDFTTENFSNQGKRSDCDAYRDAIKNGFTDRQLCDAFPRQFLRFSHSTDRMRDAYVEPRTEMTKCIWIYGPAGSGKSTMVKERFPDARFMEYDGKYFSRYYNDDTVIFDDQDMTLITPSLFLKLVNHTPFSIRVLRDYREFTAKTVVIVSNLAPDQWYVPGKDQVTYPYELPAVARRITEIIEYDWTKESIQ